MKTYDLFLHFKQGDDLSSFLEKAETQSRAFRNWADHFENCRTSCEKIADAIEKKNIEIVADTHAIMFRPLDQEAKTALNTLVAKGVLRVSEEEESNNEEESN